MRGHLIQRYEGSWSIVLDLGYQTDEATGKKKRKQKWITVRGTKKEAETRLADLVRDVHRNEFVQPHKRTFGEWLDEWLDKAIKPPAKTIRAYETYKSAIGRHLKPKLGALRLQQVKATDLKRHYMEAAVGEQPLGPATLELHHTIMHSALQAALLERLVQRNVAKLVISKPHGRRPQERAEATTANCWEVDEARRFLETAKAAGPQPAALYALALDSGARKAEFCGLKWEDIDFVARTVTIQRQLYKATVPPSFMAPKGKRSRTIALGTETVALLRQHRGHQAETKLRNREHYRECGLVFAKEWADLQRGSAPDGQPRAAGIQAAHRDGRGATDHVSRPAP